MSSSRPASMLLDIPRRFPGASEGLISAGQRQRELPRAGQPARSGGEIAAAAAGPVADRRLTENPADSAAAGDRYETTGLYTLRITAGTGWGGGAAGHRVRVQRIRVDGDDVGGAGDAAHHGATCHRDPAAVLRIEDAAGNVLWDYEAADWRVNVFSDAPELGYLVNSVFSDTALRLEEYGASSPLTPQRPTALVHGLTSNSLDDWTAGYTPNLVVSVPSGAQRPERDGTAGDVDGRGGGIVASGERGGAREPGSNGLDTAAERDRTGGVPAVGAAAERHMPWRELFIAGIQPVQPDTYWQAVEVNRQTRQRATANTPNDLRETQTSFIPPDAALDWWRANRQPLPPEDYDSFTPAGQRGVHLDADRAAGSAGMAARPGGSAGDGAGEPAGATSLSSAKGLTRRSGCRSVASSRRCRRTGHWACGIRPGWTACIRWS